MTVQEKLKKELEKLKNGKKTNSIEVSLANIDRRLGIRSTMLRGFVQGIFQFLGATLGVAIVFFFLSEVFGVIEKLPILRNIEFIQVVMREVEKQQEVAMPSEQPSE